MKEIKQENFLELEKQVSRLKNPPNIHYNKRPHQITLLPNIKTPNYAYYFIPSGYRTSIFAANVIH